MDRGEEMRNILNAATNQTKLWMLAALLSGLFAMLVASFAIYENIGSKEPTKKAASISGKQIVLSEATKRELQNIVNSEDIIVGTTVVTVDLIKNRRIPTYFYSRNADMQLIWNKFAAGGFGGITAFDVGSAKFNDRITNIMNGNFDCRLFKNTIAMQLYPEAEKYGPWLCSMSIPASFDNSGDFVGFVALYLTHEPTDQEKKHLAKLSVDAATIIYHRDVLLQPVQETVK
jgi:hypothetical protein